jgi:hypothetical protein
MSTLVGTDCAITRTAAAVTAHEAAIAAAMLRRDTTAADPEAETVGVDFDRVDTLQQHLIDDVPEAIYFEHYIRFPGFLQGHAEAADPATAQLDIKPERPLPFIFKMLGHQLRGPWRDFEHDHPCLQVNIAPASALRCIDQDDTIYRCLKLCQHWNHIQNNPVFRV